MIPVVAAVLTMTACNEKTQKAGSANDSTAVENIEDTTATVTAEDTTATAAPITPENFDINALLPALRVRAADVLDCHPEDVVFDSYALVDADGDGRPEVCLKSDEGFYKVLYSLADAKPTVLARSWGATDLYFFEHGVAAQGGCGTACMMADCTLMKDSRAVTTFRSIEESDMEGNVVETTNTQDGKTITAEAFEKLYKQLGEQLDVELEMKAIGEEETEERSKLYDYAE